MYIRSWLLVLTMSLLRLSGSRLVSSLEFDVHIDSVQNEKISHAKFSFVAGVKTGSHFSGGSRAPACQVDVEPCRNHECGNGLSLGG